MSTFTNSLKVQCIFNEDKWDIGGEFLLLITSKEIEGYIWVKCRFFFFCS